MNNTPCNWPVDYSECGGSAGQPSELPSPLDELTPEQVEKFERMAVEFLWNATNRVFGTCPVEVRPCPDNCFGNGSTFWGGTPWAAGNQPNGWTPALLNGTWYNVSCGCISSCTCTLDGSKSIQLPGPVHSIDSVIIDGVELPEEAYRLNFGRIVTLIGEYRFPGCQDLNKDTSEVGTYAIRYQRGLEVPIGGQFAAGKLALELAKAFCGSNGCELPERVQTITRQGVTVGFMDLFEGLDEGRTGIWVIDSWITSVTRPRPIAGVRSPDIKPKVGGRAWRR